MAYLSGTLDIVTPSGIYGWVHAGVAPGRLARVTCTDRQGRSVTFVTTEHRPDVASVAGAFGKFGFAAPLDLFDELERQVTFTDEDGAVLVHGVDVVLPDPTRRERSSAAPLPVILHIPKTGGTSLRHAMGPHLSKAESTYIYATQDTLSYHELSQVPAHQRACSRLVMGHVWFGIGEQFGHPAAYAAFLRRPAARLKSNLTHLLAGAGDDGARIDDVITTFNEGGTADFDNIMTRMIAGVSNEAVPFGSVDRSVVDQAIHNIITSFFFVGLMEQFREHSTVLGEMLLGRTLAPTFDNVSRSSTLERLGSVDWEGARHRNRFDQMLYDTVVERGLAGTDPRHR